MQRKKLIEVALPLDAINRESAREKSIRHGHPSALHLWWARRPLAACRAVLFASLVDDPSSRPEEFSTTEEQQKERERLFALIEELVKWESSNNPAVLEAVRKEIERSTDGAPPRLLDPFCGGGAIPLEAQRLGLEVRATDLNPVAVLISKALVELPTRFQGTAPVNPEARGRLAQEGTWRGARGLSEDIQYYGRWIRGEAAHRIGHLYPDVTTADGRKLKVIAWIWARMVACSNPACGISTPLVRAFTLATKPGKEAAVDVVIEQDGVRFVVRNTLDGVRGPTVDRHGARCVSCATLIPLEHIAQQGRSGRITHQLMATVALGNRSRVYVSPTPEQEEAARKAVPADPPASRLPDQALGFRVQRYGMERHADLFTARQLCTLETFTELVREVGPIISADAEAAGIDGASYAQTVQTYLGLTASKLAAYNSTLCSWLPGPKYEVVANVFTRQAVSMTWDFAEANPFAGSSGDFVELVDRGSKVLELGTVWGGPPASVLQVDARAADLTDRPMVSTDPPYYDNIGYADLSDFFYIWLRRGLSELYPQLFATLLTPKEEELVANPFKFAGDKARAERFFEDGMKDVFARLAAQSAPDFPLTVFYAFKQTEERAEDDSVASTGWETMLEALLSSGLAITGTWPIRTERSVRPRGQQSNALASSVVLVCRPRSAHDRITTRREFITELRRELPDPLRTLQHESIAPVDLAQASIGPGMAVYSKYAKVVEADGSSMKVRAALGLINQVLDELLAEQEGDFDSETRFAVTWFGQHGFEEGAFGDADVLARAKDTSTKGLETAGILVSRAGRVRLVRRDELSLDWDPTQDRRLTVWEATQHLVRNLEQGGESAASKLLRRLGGVGDVARELAYRLFASAERQGWAAEALAYNSLVIAWPELQQLASRREPEQGRVL